MGILEWLGESANPGPVGGLGVGKHPLRPRSRLVVLVRAALALASLALVLSLIWPADGSYALPRCVALGLYLVVSHLVHPQPDYSNVGWLGGLIDHPFRWSDDANRFLVLLLVFLWPGRFVVESLQQLVRLLWAVGSDALS